MAILFPTALDALTNPSSADSLDTVGVFHDVQHADVNDAIEALEAKVGINGSAVTTSIDYKLGRIIDGSYAASSDDVVKSRVTGDAQPRFTLNADGNLEWGPGNAVLDIAMTRNQAADPYLSVNSRLHAFRSLASDFVLTAGVTGDALSRWAMLASGLQEWGGGTLARDTNLYRAAADQLKTDDSFFAAVDIFARAGAATEVAIGARGPANQAGIQFGTAQDTNLYRSAADTLKTDDALIIAGNVGFYGQAATAKPTGVAVTAAGIHAALVTLNLIAA